MDKHRDFVASVELIVEEEEEEEEEEILLSTI